MLPLLPRPLEPYRERLAALSTGSRIDGFSIFSARSPSWCARARHARAVLSSSRSVRSRSGMGGAFAAGAAVRPCCAATLNLLYRPSAEPIHRLRGPLSEVTRGSKAPYQARTTTCHRNHPRGAETGPTGLLGADESALSVLIRTIPDCLHRHDEARRTSDRCQRGDEGRPDARVARGEGAALLCGVLPVPSGSEVMAQTGTGATADLSRNARRDPSLQQTGETHEMEGRASILHDEAP
jgi:hypothetical protein